MVDPVQEGTYSASRFLGFLTNIEIRVAGLGRMLGQARLFNIFRSYACIFLELGMTF